MTDVAWGTSSSGSWTISGPTISRTGSDDWGSTYIDGDTGISPHLSTPSFISTFNPGASNFGFIGFDQSGGVSDPSNMDYCISYQATNVRYYNSGTWTLIPDSSGYNSNTEFTLELTTTAVNVYIDGVLKYTDTHTVTGTYTITSNIYTAGVELSAQRSIPPTPSSDDVLLPPPVAWI